jgi:uncharacterized protein (TIGR02271 family)
MGWEYTVDQAKPEETFRLPLVAEVLSVGKEAIVTGGVRVSTHVTEHLETVDALLLRDEVTVERVPINRQVTEVPQPYQGGDTWVIPILEEVLVVEKRLVLKEEVRIRRTQTEVHTPQTMTVRAEEAVIEEMTPEEVSLHT